jgi:hypothetical protein
MTKRARIPGIRNTGPQDDDRAFVRIEMLTSSAGIFHLIGARLSPNSYGNQAVSFPIHFVTTAEREAEVVASLERNEAPPERPTTVPADFVKLETEDARRQAEPIIAISGFGWQHYVENPDDIAVGLSAGGAEATVADEALSMNPSTRRCSATSGGNVVVRRRAGLVLAERDHARAVD